MARSDGGSRSECSSISGQEFARNRNNCIREGRGESAAIIVFPDSNAVRGQPPRTAFGRVFLALSHRGRSAVTLQPAARQERRRCPSQVAGSSSMTPGNRSENQRPVPAARAGRGEAATPGQPVRFRILEVPCRQFALTDHRPPLALPQSSGKLRNSHVSLKTLLSRCSQLAIEKHCTIVQNLWTIRLACGKQRKTKNQILRETIELSPSV